MDIDLSQFSNLGSSDSIESSTSPIDFYSLASADVDNQGLTELESDVKNLTFGDLVNKYGVDLASQLTQGYLDGLGNYKTDAYGHTRDALGVVRDTALGVGQGLVNSAGGLASLGLSAIPGSGNAGVTVAKLTNLASQGLDSLKTEDYQQARRAYEARGKMYDRESEALYQRDLQEESPILAQLRKVGRDVLNTGANLSSGDIVTGDIGAQGAGSLLLGGPIAKGIKELGSLALLARAGATQGLNPLVKAQVARSASALDTWLPTTMALEGGGGYASGVQDVLDLPTEILLTNPDFVSRVNTLKAQGVPENQALQQAREDLANEVGLSTAGISAITAGGLSKFSKWAEHPFSTRSLVQGVQNIGSETMEEALQGAGTQFGQNLAVKYLADKDRNLTDDIGRNITEGAVGGALSAGGVQSISVPAKTLSNRSIQKESVARSNNLSLMDEIDNFNTKALDLNSVNEPSESIDSEESTSNTSNTSNTLVEEVSKEPSRLEQEKEYFNKSITLSEDETNNLSEESRKVLKDTRSRADAINALVQARNNSTNQLERDNFNLDLYGLVQAFTTYIRNLDNSEYLEGIEENSPEATFLNNTFNTVVGLTNSASFKKEVKESLERIKALREKELTKENINTQEGQQIVKATLASLATDPNSVKESNINLLLDNPSSLSDEQKNLLSSVAKVLSYKKKYFEAKDSLSNTERVSFEISSKRNKGSNKGKLSALDHLNNLIKAYASKDSVDINKTSNNLNLFLEHMKNKAEASKESLANKGKSITYQAYSAEDKSAYDAHISVKSAKLNDAIQKDYEDLARVVDDINSTFNPVNTEVVSTVGVPSNERVEAYSEEAMPLDTDTLATSTEAQIEPSETHMKASTSVPKVKVEVKEQAKDIPSNKRVEVHSEEVTSINTTTPKEVTGANTSSVEAHTEVEKESPRKNLVEKANEVISKAFKSNGSINTDILSSERPSAVVLEKVNSNNDYSENYKKAIDKLIGNDSFINSLKIKLNKNLAEALKAKVIGDDSQTVLDNLLGSGEVLYSQNGKILNLVTKAKDGSYVFNDHFLDLALLATIDWLLTKGSSYSKNDFEDVLNALNLERDELSAEDKLNFDKSVSISTAIRDLANSIQRFWGVSYSKDVPLGLSEGIVGAMSSNIVKVLATESNLISETTVPCRASPNGKVIRVKQLIIEPSNNALFKNEALRANKGIIQELVLKDPERRSFYDDDKMPSPPKKVLHTDVPTTEVEKNLINKVNNIVYYPNPLTFDFIKALGLEGFNKLLGVDTTNISLNKGHKAVLESRALTYKAAYEQLLTAWEEMLIRAKKANKNVWDVTRKFAFDIASQGRLQERYPNGPVTNKLTRILFRATKATVDLSDKNSKPYKIYLTAISQALGTKIGRKSLDENTTKAEDLLAKLKPALKILQDWYTTQKPLSDTNIQAIRDNMQDVGADITPESIHTLLDYAKLQATPLEERKNFTTYLSIEADGIAHGTIATLMFAEGIPDSNWFDAVLKGGVSFGSNLSVKDSFKKANNQDIYAAEGEKTGLAVQEVIRDADNNIKILAKSLLKVMGLAFNTTIDTDPLFDENSEKGFILNIPRAITKTFGTVKIYGSGIEGLSNNAVGPLMEQIYTRLSKVYQLKQVDPSKSFEECFFPDLSKEEAKKAYKIFKTFLLNITRNTIVKYKDELTFITNKNNRDYENIEHLGETLESIRDFAFNSAQTKAIETNIRMLLGNQANAAIEDTLGNVFNATKAITDTTSFMSNVYGAMYKYAFTKKLEEKTSGYLGDTKLKYRKHYGLSPKDVQEVKTSLNGWNPLINLGSHYIEMPKFNRVSSGIKQAVPLGKGDTYSFTADMTVPSSSGVSCVPKIIIGSGDASMIRSYVLSKGAETQANLVFDGIETSIENAEASTHTANKAMAEAYNTNILAPVNRALESFMDTYRKNRKQLEEALEDNKTRVELLNGIFRFDSKVDKNKLAKLNSKALADKLYEHITNIYYDSLDKELQIQARLNVQNKHHITVDNMSSLNQGYSNGVAETELTDAEFRAQMISEINNEYDRLLDESKVFNAEKQENTNSPEAVVKTKEFVLSKDYLTNLIDIYIKNKVLNPAQANLLRAMTNKIASQRITLHTGTLEELIQQSINNRDAVPSGKGILNGWYSVGSNHIYIPNKGDKIASVETLLHELIHATTAQNIFDYYLHNKGSAKVIGAIKNLEKLMVSFVNEHLDYLPSQIRADLINQLDLQWNDSLGRYSFPEVSTRELKAKHLNEFIAYTLSNPDLIDKAKKESIPQAILNKIKLIYAKIKEFVLGANVPNTNDFYEHVRFNTQIVMNESINSSTTVSKALASLRAIEVEDTQLADLANRYYTSVNDALNTSSNIGKERIINKATANNAIALIEQAKKIGFTFTNAEANAFAHIFNGLQLATQLNTPALIKAQEYFSYIVDRLDPKDLGVEKFNFVSGRTRKNKSLILPQFIALASVNPELRSLISEVDMSGFKKRSTADNFADKAVDNIGYSLMDTLDNYLIGNKPTNNMLTSLDSVIDSINQINETNIISEREASILDRMNDSLSKKIQGKNTELGLDTEGLNKEDKVFYKKLEDEIQDKLSKVTRSKEELISVFNTLDVSSTFNQLFRDVFGTDAKGRRFEGIIKRAKAVVQQTRQRYREVVPYAIKKLFSDKVTKQDYELMTRVLAKTDVTALTNRSFDEAKHLFDDFRAVEGIIRTNTQTIREKGKSNADLILKKANELAEYMVNGKVSSNLLRNAYAIANLFGEVKKGNYTIDKDMIISINKLVSALALKKIDSKDRERIKELFNTETEGMEAIIAILRESQDKENYDNRKKKNILSRVNGNKGFVPNELEPAQTLRVVPKGSNESKALDSLGYSLIDSTDAFDYYYLDVNTSGNFSRGGFQNVISSVYGVDPITGRSVTPGVGRITNKVAIKALMNSSNVIPVYGSNGSVIALESVNTDKVNNLLKKNTDLPEMLGAQLGRKYEESKAKAFNSQLIKALEEEYKKDPDKSDYVNVFDLEDPIIKNAVSLLTEESKEYMNKLFDRGNFLPVRKDLVEEIMGIRQASVGDLWTGESRWSPEVQKTIKQVFEVLLGKGAYAKLLKAEAAIQKGSAYARNWIVVKNPAVVLGNIASNVVQLLSNGIPLTKIVPLTLKYVKEIEQFTKAENDIVNLELQYKSAKTSEQRSAIRAKINSKRAIQAKLDIKPLIDAGEFSSIADIGVKPEEVEFSFGKFGDYLEAQIDKLPEGIKTAGKYALITKDTSLYQGLNKAVQYGDLIAKAIFYEYLTNRKNYSKDVALDIVRDEFVNYDLQTGRVRGYLENMGLLWFYNYKLRSVKSAIGIIKRNPLYGLIGLAIPQLPLLDDVSTVYTDNIFTKFLDGGLTASIGPGMFSNIPFVSPVSAILH